MLLRYVYCGNGENGTCRQTVAAAADVRGPVYYPVTSRLMDSDVILMRMANVNWEVKELCSQHSAYVDLMLRVSCDVGMIRC